jgi:hypothetical protein
LSNNETEDSAGVKSDTAGEFQTQGDSLSVVYVDSSGEVPLNIEDSSLAVLSIVNYDHIAGYTITFTSTVDTGQTYIITVPEKADSAAGLQKIPAGIYDIHVSKPGNTQSLVFTISGPEGEIIVNGDEGNWINVPLNTKSFNKISVSTL